MTGRPVHAESPIEVFYSPAYVAAAVEFDTTRKAGLLAADLTADPVDGVVLVTPNPAYLADIERVHDHAYVRAIVTGEPEELAASAGLGWDHGFSASVRASAGGCIAAARSAWQRGVAGSLSSGLHHARSDHGAGYCTVNGLALAANAFRDLGAERVLIIDLDAHCGGGTAEILGGDSSIGCVDIATDSYDSYAPVEGWTLDIVDEAEAYLDTIAARLAEIPDGLFDAIVYNAGMDPHEDCTLGGLDGIHDDVIVERERMVFGFAAAHQIPIAFVLAGGYTSDSLSAEDLTYLHRLTVEAAAGRLGAPVVDPVTRHRIDCASYRPGHTVHHIQARLGFERPWVTGRVSVDDEGWIDIDTESGHQRAWTHNPAQLREFIAVFGDLCQVRDPSLLAFGPEDDEGRAIRWSLVSISDHESACVPFPEPADEIALSVEEIQRRIDLYGGGTFGVSHLLEGDDEP